MYSEDSILFLKNRIGFGSDRNIALSVDEIHQTGTSGRLITFFHKLANLENLEATVNDADMNSEEFNAYLSQFKTDAVKSVLSSVLNKNKLYRDDVDYSGTILTRPELFDDAIGYTMAIAALEQFISTSRKNNRELDAKLSYDLLKIELEGIVDDNGSIRSKGLMRYLYYSINNASSIIFPKEIVIKNANVW